MKALHEYTITMASGTRFGGRYSSKEHARKVNELFGKVMKVERKPLFSKEESRELREEKLEYMCRD